MGAIAVLDEGYYFGLGAFETIALEDGRPIMAEQHLARLAGTLEFLGIGVGGSGCSDSGVGGSDGGSDGDAETGLDEMLGDLLAQGLALEGAQAGSKALKMAVSAENRSVTLRDNVYDDAVRSRGFSLMTSKVRRNESSPLVRHKTFNYGDCIMEKRRAKATGFDEALFLNTRGYLAEGAITNVFAVIGGELVTPPVEDGLLPGVMRAFVLSQFDVEQRSISLEEARRCDEMFLTNSLMGAMPVKLWDGEPVGNGQADKSQEVQRAYEEHVARRCSQDIR